MVRPHCGHLTSQSPCRSCDSGRPPGGITPCPAIGEEAETDCREWGGRADSGAYEVLLISTAPVHKYRPSPQTDWEDANTILRTGKRRRLETINSNSSALLSAFVCKKVLKSGK